MQISNNCKYHGTILTLFCICLCRLCQSQAVKPVEREPYTGDVVAVANSGKRDVGSSELDTPTRPSTRHGGVRDLHESSFSLSGMTAALT